MNKSNDQVSKPTRKRNIAYWIFTGLVVLEMLVGAGWDLFRIQFVKDVFIHLGYPNYLLTILGVWKLLAAVVLVISRFPIVKEWAYAGMFFEFTGAVASHIAVGDGFSVWIALIFFTLFTGASWALRPPSRKLA
jgi:DoxX-like family